MSQTHVDLIVGLVEKVGGIEKVNELRKRLTKMPESEHANYLRRVASQGGASMAVAWMLLGVVTAGVVFAAEMEK